MSESIRCPPPSGHPPSLSHRLYQLLAAFRRNGRRPLCTGQHLDPLAVETERLAHDVVLSAIEKGNRSPGSIEACLRNCVQTMLQKHSIVFGGMMNRLRMDREDFSKGFNEVAEELFKDEISWSKVLERSLIV